MQLKRWALPADILIFIFCLVGVHNIWLKADLPFSVNNEEGRLVVSNSRDHDIPDGSTLLRVDNYPAASREEIEMIMDRLPPGSKPLVVTSLNGYTSLKYVTPVPFYSSFYLFSVLLSGCIFFLAGIIILLQSSDIKAARVFHWASVGTGTIIMTTWGNFNAYPYGISLIARLIFNCAYVFVPAAYAHFTFVFPDEVKRYKRTLLALLYSPAFLLFVFSSVTFLLFASDGTYSSLSLHLIIFNLCRIFIVTGLILATIRFTYSYIRTGSVTGKKKLKWLLLSFIAGPGSFAALWVIPQALTAYGLIPEELVIILITTVPAGFAIAILRYHLMNIDLLLNRSMVYSITLAAVAAAYILVISSVSGLIGNINHPLLSVVSATVIALFFHPVKTKVQNFVDKRFFRIRYNFRAASRRLLEEIKYPADMPTFSKRLINELSLIIPVDKMALLRYDPSDESITVLASWNMKFSEISLNYFKDEKLLKDFRAALGYRELVEPGSAIGELESSALKRVGINLLFPLIADNSVSGFLMIGRKSSGDIFTIEDIDLYNEVAIEASINIERLQLQESLLRRQMEEEKLRELNEMKSFFLSGVSHDLKTPLTSIRMFSELMELYPGSSISEQQGYLRIIQGECQRLTRLIDNVLDLSKIEKGIKEYNFTCADLNELMNYSVSLMDYQFRIEKCSVSISPSESPLLIYADKDCIISAIVNLLSNAVKYSSEPKVLNVALHSMDDAVRLCIQNNGPEISPAELEKLGTLYYRQKEMRHSVSGSGLGLYLVKQIMEVHHGCLEISSSPSSGSRFDLVLPLWRNENKLLN